MAILILVRNGQSYYNLKNFFTGNVDVELTDLGKEDARLAGEKLKGFNFETAYTSMLKRGQESLCIILEVIGQTSMTVVKNVALNEGNYGSLQGLNKAG
jgi:2,3-bisphosphoglycerate-dependent phosphoglycerate mutase